MDDLSGLDWTTTSSTQKASTPVYPSLRPSPAPSSGRSTPNVFRPPPASTSQLSTKVGSKPVTPANDSFANLLSGGNKKAASSLSLQERQRQLAEERAKKSQQFDSHFGKQNGVHVSRSSSGVSGPPGVSSLPVRSTQSPNLPLQRGQDDILAAFNSSAKVDSSSHFPPAYNDGRTDTPSGLTNGVAFNAAISVEDDDPFDLSSFNTRPQQSSTSVPHDDDGDILGMLGRPVHEVSAPKVTQQAASTGGSSDHAEIPTSEADRAVAELVDMGFSSDRAAVALAQTESGHDVRSAVGILLHQAHEETRRKPQGSQNSREEIRTKQNGSEIDSRGNVTPSWARERKDDPRSSSQTRAHAGGEKDVAKIASDLGNTLFKSANSLWKTSQKKVQKAMADLQQDGAGTSQPKWMKDSHAADTNGNGKAPRSGKSKVTDEAAMLESGADRSTLAQQSTVSGKSYVNDQGRRTNAMADNFAQPMQQSMPAQNGLRDTARKAHRATREQLEHNAPEAYISPARRRKPQSSPPEAIPASQQSRRSPLAIPPLQSNNPFRNVAQKPQHSSPASAPAPVRPKAPPRRIPPVSSSALSSASHQRKQGSEAFKRGDFASAHAAYSSALQPLPQSHPITIVIFCNRSLTSLKNGDPKAAISDAECALEVIGISRGEGERIDLGHAEGQKDMKEFYGKALMRKAEALENMEKWAEAGKVWRDAVEAGVGGSISIQGRNRCEKASDDSDRPSAPKKPVMKPSRAVRRPAINHVASQEAVKKLRQANEAAERADDEKFALTDQVDAKLSSWKGTKADNLRALLGSLDKVLWAEAGWTKVGMADLVMVNRVKIIYMKAIAKVHPDKISQSATTEQRMLSAAIFSTLNEAWDKFKQENNL